MGFIDWHKNKKDHYEDVLDYAKARREEETRQQKDKMIRNWIGERLADPRYANVKSSDAMKLLVREYQSLKNGYSTYAVSVQHQNDIDPELLWKDLWTTSIEQILAMKDLSVQQKTALLSTMQEKVLHLHAPLSAEQHQHEKQNNRKYRHYLENCFAIGADMPMQFWRYIYHIRQRGEITASKLLARYNRCRLLFAYYLYLSGEAGADWIMQMEPEVDLLADIQHKIERGTYEEPDCKKLHNPLFVNRDATFDELSKMAKVLLFNFRAKSKFGEGGIKMIEELYAALDDGIIAFERITSILPVSVREQINSHVLPAFPKPELQLLTDEEQLYYLDHAVLFQGKAQDDEVTFRSFKGTVYFTDQRLIFQGDGQVIIRLDSIEQIIEYDLIPELLEVICNGKSNFLQLPDVETAYRILKLIANRNRGEVIEEINMPFTYEELVDKADLGACIFAFEYVMSGDIPALMKDLLLELTPKLRCLQKTVIQYPEKKGSIYQFLHYYVPEAVKIVAEYQQYQFVGLDDRHLQNVYEKITAAIRALDLAVLQKIAEIYNFATMDTVAHAEALREILSQDGLVDTAYAIK